MELIIKCERCNSLLDGDIGSRGELYVDLCPTCEKEIRDEVYDKGHDEGYEQAISDFK